MEILQRNTGSISILDIKGDIDISNSHDLRCFIENNIRDGEARIILNLSEVSYIDSAGVGNVVALLKCARKQGGDLRLIGVQDEVRYIFEITRLNSLFKIFNNEVQAVESFNIQTEQVST